MRLRCEQIEFAFLFLLVEVGRVEVERENLEYA